MIISFSGLDGTGKSTHVHQTACFLRERGKKTLGVAIYSLSLYSVMGQLLNRAARGLSQKLVQDQFEVTKKSRQKKILSVVRCASLLPDVVLFFCLVVFPARLTGRVVICDRYFFDALIQLRYLKMCSPLFFQWALTLIPVPDIPIILMAEPFIAYRRKPEYPTDYYVTKHGYYKAVAAQIRSCHVVESRGIDQTQAAINRLLMIHGGAWLDR